MQDMIRRIIEADNEAKALEEKNRRAAEAEKQKIEEQAAAIYNESMENAREKIAKNDEYLEKKYAGMLAETEAKQESTLIKLRADYERSCDKWVDEIVARVIG